MGLLQEPHMTDSFHPVVAVTPDVTPSSVKARFGVTPAGARLMATKGSHLVAEQVVEASGLELDLEPGIHDVTIS